MANLVKADKFFQSKAIIKQKTVSFSSKKESGNGTLLSIEKKVIQVDKLLKNSLLLSKKEGEKKRVKTEEKTFEDKEKELEKKKPKDSQAKGIKLPSPPSIGIFGWIKNFVINTFLGFIAVRLIDHLPTLLKALPVIMKAGETIIDFAGGILNGLVTFIDWGYKAIDGTRAFMKTIGGDGLAQNFDKFTGAMSTMLDIAVIAALATADSGGGGDLLDMGGDFVRDKLLQRGAQQAAQTAAGQAAGTAGGSAGTTGGAAGLGGAAVAGAIIGAGLLASALGEGAFQLRKVATKPMQDARKAFDNEKNPFMKIGRGVFLGGMNMLLGPLSALGVLLDVVGAPFRYAIELLRFPFLSEEDKKKQAYNLAKMDARIREDFRKALNIVTLGFAFKEKGSFGNIYGDKGAQKEMMGKMAGGGPTSKKTSGNVPGRTLTRKKKSRSLSVTPPKIKPGNAVGGQKNIEKIFPEGKDKTKVNPLGFLNKAYDTFGKSAGLGGILAMPIKAILGDQITEADYTNAGNQLNGWLNSILGIQTAYAAGGGEIDASDFINGGDYGDVLAKSIKNSISSDIDKAIQDLMKNLTLKQLSPDDKAGGKGTDGDLPPGTGSLTGNTNAEKVFNYLIGYGFTPQAAAGVVGNLMQESGVNPNSNQGGGGAGRGIMQWGTGAGSGGRWDALTTWAQSSGKDPRALDTQVEWMMREMNQRGTIKRLPKLTNVKAATDLFEKEMEGAGTPMMEKRYSYAADALASFGGGGAGGGGDIALGKGYGSAGGKIAGELGRYIKQKLRQGDDFQAVTEHPEHGGVGPPGVHAKGSYHYKGRAIDIGAFAREQPPILKVIAQFNKMKGVQPVQLLKAGDPGHGNHVHVAYSKGGFISKPTRILVGERGREFIIDADSTLAFEQKLPGFLLKANAATNKNQLMQILKSYTEYERPEPQVVQVPVPTPSAPSGGGGYGGGGGGEIAMSGGGVNSNADLFEGLSQKG